MHESKDNLPLLLDAPGATLRSVRGGEMTVDYAKCAAGTDFTPVLKGLEDDMCQCPHWGYVLKGALHLRYTDGREETVRAGEVWYAAPGHTAWCDEDTEYIDVNPSQELRTRYRSHKEADAVDAGLTKRAASGSLKAEHTALNQTATLPSVRWPRG